MNIYVSQFYIEAGANYPFSHRFNHFISKAIADRIASPESFVQKYGEDFDLIFRMSARSDIQDTLIKGPAVFQRDKDVEYSIFLPYNGDNQDPRTFKEVVARLLSAIINVLTDLGFDASAVLRDSSELADQIVENPAMIDWT